jgi:TolB-like protein/Tfp pilus assembly protein PilF
MSLFSELKRRNVIRVAMAYVVAAWLIIQVVETISPAFGFSDAALRYVIIVLAIALIPTLVLSWIFEITPEGLKREVDVTREHSITRFTGKKLDRIIIVLLALALGYFSFDKFVLDPARDAEIAESAAQEGARKALAGVLDPHFRGESIAVLPFVNMSDDATNEFFSDGISEELLNLLAKIPELRVIARTSSFAYKGKDVKIDDVARELDVSHVLEGSVRKSGNQVRITAQLIRASDSTHLWSETFDRTLDNIFVIQDEIAAAVVEQLRITLLGQVPKARELDPEAYSLFLQARHYSNHGSAESINKAREILQQVLVTDPDHAPAWAELGRIYANQVSMRQIGSEEAYAKSLEALNKALQLDPGNAIAYSRLGWNKLYIEGDLAASAAYFEQALTLEPGNAIVLGNAATLSRTLGRFDQAVRLGEFALQRDPLNPTYSYNLGWSYLVNWQLEEAESAYRRTLLLSPNRPGARALLARVLYHRSDKDDLAVITDLVEQEPFELMRLTASSVFRYRMGDIAQSNAALQTLIEEHKQVAGVFIALVYAIRGESDQVFEWLHRSLESQGPQALMNSWYAPEYKFLHQDPRWDDLLASAGISEQQLAAIPFEVILPRQD